MSYFQFYQPFTGVVRHLIIMNALMFVGTYVILGSEVVNESTYQMESLGRMNLAAYLPGSEHYQPFQIVTYMFMHADLRHLIFNMLSLYFFGPMVEMVWGHKRFLFYYLACGIGAWVLHMGVQWWELERMGYDPTAWNGAMLGASGSVFGVLIAFGYLFPNQVINMIFPPISIKAKYLVLIMAGIELFYGVRGDATGVAHYAHLGGGLCGFILILIWNRFSLRS